MNFFLAKSMRMWIFTFLLLALAKSISGCSPPPPPPRRYSNMSIIIKMIMINELDSCKWSEEPSDSLPGPWICNEREGYFWSLDKCKCVWKASPTVPPDPCRGRGWAPGSGDFNCKATQIWSPVACKCVDKFG